MPKPGPPPPPPKPPTPPVPPTPRRVPPPKPPVFPPSPPKPAIPQAPALVGDEALLAEAVPEGRHFDVPGMTRADVNQALDYMGDASREQRLLFAKWMRQSTHNTYIVPMTLKASKSAAEAKRLLDEVKTKGTGYAKKSGVGIQTITANDDANGWTWCHTYDTQVVHVITDNKRVPARITKASGVYQTEAVKDSLDASRYQQTGKFPNAPNYPGEPDSASKLPRIYWTGTSQGQAPRVAQTMADLAERTGSSYLGTYIHELGHRIHAHLAGTTAAPLGFNDYGLWRVYKGWKRTMMFAYQRTNQLEWFAEGFATWFFNREAVRAIDPDLDEYFMLCLRKVSGEKIDEARLDQLSTMATDYNSARKKRKGLGFARTPLEQYGDEVARATMRFLDLCTRKPKGWREEARKVYAEAPEESQAHIRELAEAFIVAQDLESWPLGN